MVKQGDIPSLLLQRVGRAQFLNDRVLSDFFFAWLRSPHYARSIAPGRSNGVPHISPNDVERISFSPPPVNSQRRIVAYLDNLQAKVDALKRLQAETAAELDARCPRYWIRHSAASFRGTWHGAVAECALRQLQVQVPARELTQYRQSDEAQDSRRGQTLVSV